MSGNSFMKTKGFSDITAAKFNDATPTKGHTLLTPAEAPEPTEPPKKKVNRKKKPYFRLDISGFESYLNDAVIRESQKIGKPISKTSYIRGLISQDRINNAVE